MIRTFAYFVQKCNTSTFFFVYVPAFKVHGECNSFFKGRKNATFFVEIMQPLKCTLQMKVGSLKNDSLSLDLQIVLTKY